MTAQPTSIAAQTQPAIVDIRPLLQRLWPDPAKENVTAQEIADAISLIFPNHLSPVQTGSSLTCLHFTGWDRRADVLAAEGLLVQPGAGLDVDMETTLEWAVTTLMERLEAFKP